MERRQSATETLPELGQSIRRLTNLAYPTAPGDVRDTFAKEKFIDALVDSDMRLRVKQARPLNHNDAIRHAVELEAFIKSDRKMLESNSHLRPLQTCKLDCETAAVSTPNPNNALEDLASEIKQLRKDINDMKMKTSQPLDQNGKSKDVSKRNCYKCGSGFHLQADRPENHAEKYKII